MDAESIAHALGGKQSGSGFMCTCPNPSHDDKRPSCSVKDVDGKTLVHCFAGCSQTEVIESLRSMGLWHTSPNQKYAALTQQRAAEIEHAKLIIQLARGDVARHGSGGQTHARSEAVRAAPAVGGGRGDRSRRGVCGRCGPVRRFGHAR